MTPILDNAVLGSDLDFQNKDILNILHMYPVPTGLVDNESDAMNGPLPVLDSSVTNSSVAATAEIDQSKLNLNGSIPEEWLDPGAFSGHYAAQGDLAEIVSYKGNANGYAPLNLTGKIPSIHITPGAQPGTVNTVGMNMPPEFSVTDPVVTSGVLAASWVDAPDGSWFGVNGSIGLETGIRPSFLTEILPIELVPPLSGTSFTSGTFALEQLPVAVGMGTGHSTGILTDPGETGQASDYIGRDMKWHRFTGNQSYQPELPKPNIVLASWTGGNAKITIRCLSSGSFLFYRVTSGTPSIYSDFINAPADHVTLNVLDSDYIEAYSAKAGYNNSDISDYVVITPISGT